MLYDNLGRAVVVKLRTLFLISIAFAAAAQSNAVAPEGSVEILLRDARNAPERVLREAEREVGRLLAPAGLSAEVTRVPKSRSFEHVFIVRLDGDCSTRGDAPPADLAPYAGAQRLASTQTRDGRVLPYGEVDCAHLRRLTSHAPGDRALAMGKALGKVIAHELYHLLLNTTGHARQGLAKAKVNWTELWSAAEFAPSDLRRFRRQKSPAER